MKLKLIFALSLAAAVVAAPLFAIRNIDNADLGAIRRRNVTQRMVCEFDANGQLVAVECYRVQQFRQAGVVLTTIPQPGVVLTAAELDAIAAQIRNRIEQAANDVADAKEAAQ